MNIVITGGNKGIALPTIEKLLSLNHKVLALSRQEVPTQKFSNLENFHQKRLDLSQINQVYTAIEDLPFEKVDILVNMAGILINKPFSEIQFFDLDISWKVNFLAPFVLIQKIVPLMPSGGHIVNVSTMGAVQGSVKFPGLSAYSSSKAALTNLTEILAVELENKNISCNCLALGAVQTEMLQTAFPDYKAPVTAEEMADFVVDFALKYGKLMNGKIIPVALSTP